MRIKTTAAIIAIAFLSAVAVSVIGQEEPLPVVQPKPIADIPLAEPTVVLAVEPVHTFEAPTLLGAARGNDFVSFDALYTAAKSRGEDVSQYATLHELWSNSLTDPIGAFYGRELYEQLSLAFPGYARYIDEFAIVDSRGNTFYPASETRAFLIDRIIEGRPAPRVVIADHLPIAPRPQRSARASAPVAKKADPVPVAVIPPVAITPEPVQETQPAPAPSPVVPAPVERVTQLPATQPVQPAQPTRPTAVRGMLLVIIGLIGIGLLAVILRTPRKEPPASIIQKDQPSAGNVEPLRKPPVTPPADKRAAG